MSSIATLANAVYNSSTRDSWSYWILYFLLVIAFTYFYTDVIFRQQNLAETLQTPGWVHPGHPAGYRTPSVTCSGSCRASPWWARCSWAVWRSCPGSSTCSSAVSGASRASTSTLLISSTGLLIVVGVVLDTMKQLEAQLLMRHYEGFIRKSQSDV